MAKVLLIDRAPKGVVLPGTGKKTLANASCMLPTIPADSTRIEYLKNQFNGPPVHVVISG